MGIVRRTYDWIARQCRLGKPPRKREVIEAMACHKSSIDYLIKKGFLESRLVSELVLSVNRRRTGVTLTKTRRLYAVKPMDTVRGRPKKDKGGTPN